MTVPSSVTIAKWRHVVRVLVRVVGVVFVLVSVAMACLWVVAVADFWLQGGSVGFGVIPVVAVLLAMLRPLMWAAIGVALFKLDIRLARLIVPMPSRGCPNCGYWIGSRPMDRCPECGVELTGDEP